MITRSFSQSVSNMLRCTILVLQLYGFLATCCCTILYRNANGEVSMPIGCSQSKNFTECETWKVQGAEDRENRSTAGVARMFGGEELGSEDGGDEEVTGRKKKYKKYWKILLYFLGATKLTMLYVILNAVVAMSAKALIVAKVALAIATAIALRKASEYKEKVSYEIIKHPHHSYDHSHSASYDYDHHGGYEENDLNYRKRRRIY